MNEQSTLTSNRNYIMNKYLVLVIIFTVLLFGVSGTFFFLKNSKITNSEITNDLETIKKAELPTSLLFTPATISVNNGQKFSSSVDLLTGENIVTGIDIELTYNPSVVQINKIIPVSLLGSFVNSSNWQVIRNEINNKEGNARFVAFTTDHGFGISGREVILNIEGIVKESNENLRAYQIDYGQSTVISALNKGYNVLMSKSPLTLNILK